ncbi:DUF2339 domain-containing protein [Paenibacillus sp. GCM10027627]|uniref:DUF2339 domain-containing protein n=1 Tax=unclassified Paenibacillus TaxID=185978 RepID=UPI003629958B
MKEMLKSHWTSLLGALFVIAAFITLFQYSVDQGWISDSAKIGIGLLAGIGIGMAGVKVAQKPNRVWTGQIMLGIGVCVLYATLTFAGVYYAIWEPTPILIAMTAITAGLTFYASRFQSRLLMNIAVLGALLAPLLMRPESDQNFTLFLYLLVLNCAFIYLSVVKGWLELRIVSFAGTWLMYLVYFIHFAPPLDGVWSLPIRYALSAFIFYTIALLLSSWKSKLSFDGVDLYLNAANGVFFGIWALNIWEGDVDYGIVLLLIAAVYLAAGFAVYKLKGSTSVASASFALTAVLLACIAINSFGEGVLFNILMWVLYAYLLTALGHLKRWKVATVLGAAVWFFLGFFWFIVTWSTERGDWFDVYIPFLSWGAASWILLAALGFYYARTLTFNDLPPTLNRIFSRFFALMSHFIIGGLMSKQIKLVFEVYFQDAPQIYMDLTLSVVWALYALTLMLWGAYYRERTFTWFGAAVLILVAIKAIFMDLSDEIALFKMVVLLLLGGISFLMTWINGKWKGERRESAGGAEQSQAAANDQS